MYNIDVLELDCKSGKRMEKGCSFCVVNISCECAVSTPTIYIPPRLSGCHKNTSNILHPVNLALLQHFFNNSVLKNIDSNSLFGSPLSIAVPEFRLYNHTMRNIIADDRKAHLSLKRMADSAKKDAMVFQSITDPLLSGDVVLDGDWPEWDDVLLFCTTAIAVCSLAVIILLSIKMRKLFIIVSVLQNTKFARASTLPSFIYTRQQTTTAPSFIESIELTYEHFILAIVILIFVCVVIPFIRECKVKRCKSQLLVEISNGKDCVFIPLQYLSLCL